MTGTPPPVGELVSQLVPNWIEQERASQIGISLPFGHVADCYHLLLLSIDETGYIAEHAAIGTNGQIFHFEEMPPDSPWPFSEWQELLARNAGHRTPVGGDRKRTSPGRVTEQEKPHLTSVTEPPPSSGGEHGQEYRQDPAGSQQRSDLEPEQ